MNGLRFSETYASNVFPFIKLGKKNSSIRDADMLYAAKNYALPQIEIVSPRMVICLGPPAFHAVRRAAGFADIEWSQAITPGRDRWRKWYPEGDLDDAATVFGYGVAKGLEQVLRQCGDNLTRENVMKQAANLDFEIGIYLPGTRIKTGADDFAPIEQLQMMRFKGESWERFGPVMSGERGT
jgi:hypothetical protein